MTGRIWCAMGQSEQMVDSVRVIAVHADQRETPMSSAGNHDDEIASSGFGNGLTGLRMSKIANRRTRKLG